MKRIAVIGVTESQLRDIAARVRGARIGANPAECDGVAVLRLTEGQYPNIETLLATGKPVLISAEGGLTAERLREWSKAEGRIVVANPHRYLPSRALIGQQLAAGKLGVAGLLRLHRWYGGGVDFLHSGSLWCDLELANWYFGKAPNLVYAVEQRINDSLACLQIHLGFAGGGMALLDHVHRRSDDIGYCSLSVIGSAGAAYADDHQNMQILHGSGAPRTLRTEEGVTAWAALVQDFVARDAPNIEGKILYWQTIVPLVEAIRESLRSRQAVRLQGQM